MPQNVLLEKSYITRFYLFHNTAVSADEVVMVCVRNFISHNPVFKTHFLSNTSPREFLQIPIHRDEISSLDACMQDFCRERLACITESIEQCDSFRRRSYVRRL